MLNGADVIGLDGRAAVVDVLGMWNALTWAGVAQGVKKLIGNIL